MKNLIKLPQQDIKVVLGDCNAKVGKEEHYKSTMGNHSKHEISNNDEKRLIEFATDKNMVKYAVSA